MLPPLAEIPILPSTCLALDMVATIAADPPFFSALAAKVKKGGGRVIVIVSRSPEARLSNLRLLGKYGIQYDDVIFMPPFHEAVQGCPFRDELGHAGSYLWHTVQASKLAGVTHYVIDELGVKELFRRFLSNVILHSPRELYPRDPTVKSPSSHGNGSWLFHPPSDKQYVELKSVPWEPVRMYFVTLSGDMEVLFRAVTKLNGALYNDGMVVLPSRVTLSDVNELLKVGGDGTVVKSWSETFAGPPCQ
jgi:hypothetical protein